MSLNLANEQGKEYAIGSKSPKMRNAIVNGFHDEVVRQILLGNRVLLPGDMSIEIIKHKYNLVFGKIKKLHRDGFYYKVRFTYHKLKEKRVKFTPSPQLIKKIEMVLGNTNFEYKLVDNSYK